MLEFAVLSSGSRANCLYVGCGSVRILVDCGLSARETERRLVNLGIDPQSLSAIVISHEHHDHVAGVSTLSKKLKLPVYANQGTFSATSALSNVPAQMRIEFQTGSIFEVGQLSFAPFSITHDAVDPVGFRISGAGTALGIVTDLGQLSTLVFERTRDLDALILEANHDPLLLQEAPYPWELKQRISGRNGHLSNEVAGSLVEALHRYNDECGTSATRLEFLIAAHISEKSNDPGLAVEVLKDSWERGGNLPSPEILAATADGLGRLFVLGDLNSSSKFERAAPVA